MLETVRNLAAAGIFMFSGPAVATGESFIHDASHVIPIESVDNVLDWLGKRETAQDSGETLLIMGANVFVWWASVRFSDSTKNCSVEEKLLWAAPTLLSTGSAIEVGLIWS